MEITRNKLHIAMWDDEAKLIEAALDIALDLFEDYRLKPDEDQEADARHSEIVKAEGVLNTLLDKLRDTRPDFPKKHGASIREELRKSLMPIARLGSAS